MAVKKDEVRARIIQVAAKIFTRYGFKKTSMEEIAVASKKGKSSIYYYFSSKEDIFKAVVEMEAEVLKKDLRLEIAKVEDPIEQLKKYILFRMHKMNTLTNFYAAMKSDCVKHLNFIEKIRKDYDKNEIKLVSEILERGMKTGQFIIADPGLSAVALVTAMKGLEIPLFLNKEHGKIEDRLENLIRMLFYGLVKR